MAVLMGCIADDFTGGTDLASMLVKSGMRTVQLGIGQDKFLKLFDHFVCRFPAPNQDDFRDRDFINSMNLAIGRLQISDYRFHILTLVQARTIYLGKQQMNKRQMSTAELGGRFTFPGTSLTIRRMGYGAMQLAGRDGNKLVWGPPRDIDGAIAVLRAAVASGINHIDTSDFYGPHITNQLIRRALHPYPDNLVIVTKVSARRGEDGSWLPAMSPEELTQAVHDNLRNLGLEVLDVVNLRSMLDVHGPAEGSLEEPLTTLAELREKGLIRHVGLSNVTRKQIEDARKMVPIVCVQNAYNVAHRADDPLIDELEREGIAYVPFFPLGGFNLLQSSALSDVAQALSATPMQVALAWLLQRSSNILLIPGTSSVGHLRENLASAELTLPPDALKVLDQLASKTEAAQH
jgi:pyridoxine 4-dehydrogenase